MGTLPPADAIGGEFSFGAPVPIPVGPPPADVTLPLGQEEPFTFTPKAAGGAPASGAVATYDTDSPTVLGIVPAVAPVSGIVQGLAAGRGTLRAHVVNPSGSTLDVDVVVDVA